MSKAQLEDGYTRIANDLLEAIMAAPFSKREISVLLAVIRKTYGYGRKTDSVSGWQIAAMTNIDRSHVSKTISGLIKARVLITGDRCRIGHGQEVKEIGINTAVSDWLTVAESATVNRCQNSTGAKLATVAESATVTVAELATKPLPKQPTHKERKKERNVYVKSNPPTVEEVAAYCATRNNTVDPVRFVSYYTSNGWKVSKNFMVDWKAAVHTWEKPRNGTQTHQRDDRSRAQRHSDALRDIAQASIERERLENGGAEPDNPCALDLRAVR